MVQFMEAAKRAIATHVTTPGHGALFKKNVSVVSSRWRTVV